MFPFSDPETIGGTQAIADVTAYIADMQPNPEPGKGDGKKSEHGKSLFNTRCSLCHGLQGEGRAKVFYPRLRGQHYAYLVRQLKWMQNGFRENADPAMLDQLKGLSEQDTEALADYISRLPTTGAEK
jgi:cytochrome c553